MFFCRHIQQIEELGSLSKHLLGESTGNRIEITDRSSVTDVLYMLLPCF